MRTDRHLEVLAVIATGGALGSLARLALTEAIPHSAQTAFPTATFVTNIAGCFAIGLLMTYVLTVGKPSRYTRPFLGTGVLGGFTTFSAYAVETRELLAASAYATAAAYVVGTVIGCLLAVHTGIALARAALHHIFRGRA
ncbi:MAG: fluoride efflux transporter CrcB [Dehalococcoidia bacterium]